MADLTVLSSMPIYPGGSGSRSNVYNSFIPGASSSRFSLNHRLPHMSTLKREDSDETISDTEQDTSEDGQDTDDTSSLSSVDDALDKPLPPLTMKGSTKTTRKSSGSSLPRGRHDSIHSDDDEEIKNTPVVRSHPSLPPTPSSSSQPSVNGHDSLELPPILPRGRQSFQKHRTTRSRSAPPMERNHPATDGETTPTASLSPASQMNLRQYDDYERQGRPHTPRERTFTYNSGTLSASPSRIFPSPSWARDYGVVQGGELLKPPPPLHRPTTFWRRTPRSGVTASSYSPSSHLIRRSTFIAAGLTFDRPIADLSALGVESRFRNNIVERPVAQVNDVFWEVVVDR